MSSFNVTTVATLFAMYILRLCFSQDITCNEELTAIPYPMFIQSENFPSNYPNNVHCVTHIRSPESTVIELTFLAFDLEESDMCEKDALVVYDGIDGGMRLIQHSCGSRWAWPHYPEQVVSTRNELTIVFATDDEATNSMGYQARYSYVTPRPSIFVVAVEDAPDLRVIRRHSALNFAVVPEGLQSPLAVDYDPIQHFIYYTDKTAKNIGRVHIDTQTTEILHNKQIQYPFGLRIDTIGRLLYWTDADMGTVSVSSLDGNQRATLIQTGLHMPGAIVIEPNMGYIYFTDWGFPAKILKSDADGTNNATIVSTEISSPQGLTIDLSERALYWLDTLLDRLEKVNVDGSDRRFLRLFHERDPFAIVLDDDGFFFTDPILGRIEMYGRELMNGFAVRIGSNTIYNGLTLRPLFDFGTDSAYTCPRSDCTGICLPKPEHNYVCINVLPTLTTSCPEDVVRESNSGYMVTWTEPTATSPTGLLLTLRKSHQPGDLFFLGSEDVSYIFEDTLGNKLYCNFTVTIVERGNDACQTDILREIEGGNNGTYVSWDAPVYSNGTTIPISSHSEFSSGDFFPHGVTSVQYIYFLENHDRVLCIFTVTVVYQSVDVVCQEDISVEIAVGKALPMVTWNEPVDAYGQPAYKSSHSSGDIFELGRTVVTYSFFDQLDREINCSFTVIVTERDRTPPVFQNCPSDIEKWIRPRGPTSTPVLWETPVMLEDNRDFITRQSETSGSEFLIGTTHVTIVALDRANNNATCMFTVTVKVDDIPPVITGCPNNITRTVSKMGDSVSVTWIKPTITDNSGSSVYWQRETFVSGHKFPVGSTNVTYVASDHFGNKAWCSFLVIVTADEENQSGSNEGNVDMPEHSTDGVIIEYLIIGGVIAFLLLLIACLLVVRVCRKKTREVVNVNTPPPYYSNAVFNTAPQQPSIITHDPTGGGIRYTPQAQAIGGVINPASESITTDTPPPSYKEKEVVALEEEGTEETAIAESANEISIPDEKVLPKGFNDNDAD